MAWKERPSFSRYLRNVAKLGAPNCLDPESCTLEQRKRWKEEKMKIDAGWTDIRDYLLKHAPPKCMLKTKLDNLRSLSKELAGEDQTEVIDETTVLMLKLFTDDKLVSNRKLSVLKQMFGSVNLEIGNKISQMVCDIVSSLPDQCVDYIHNSIKINKHDFTKNGRVKSDSEDHPERVPNVLLMACAIAKPRKPPIPSNVLLIDMTLNRNETPSANFSMRYEDVMKKISEFNVNSKRSDEFSFSRRTGFGRSWLIQEVKSHYGTEHPVGLPVEEFCDSLMSVITSEKCNDELQGELVGLLGYDQLKLAEILMEHRNDIVYSLSVEAQGEKLKTIKQKLVVPKRPTFGCQVLVQSEEERTLQKQVRKEEKKIQRVTKEVTKENGEAELEFNPVELRKKREAALMAANRPIFREKSSGSVRKPPVDVYPHVYDSMAHAKQSSGFIAGVKLVLPANMERTDSKMYEEVTIPVSDPAPVEVGDKLVAVSSLDEIGQMAFQGIKSLNRIQTVVFDTAYHTNENLLICAPTGAGKTNVALLTILYAVRQFIQDGVIRKDQFKIVYVAPMKALAAEMTQSFGRRLGALGLTVKELTGDMQLTKTEIMQTQMLVTTPEKWDVVTRKATGDVALTSLVKLLIIDEVHLLHGDRGPVVEALVARTLRLVESSQSMIRIVGLSATLPNYLDVARFLRVNTYLGLFYFDTRFRPVPLGTTFIGVKSIKPLQQMQDMDSVCYDKVIEMVQKGHQVMVFVHARNATVRTAMVLRETAQQKGQLGSFECQGESNSSSNSSSSAYGQAVKTISRSRNKQLVELFSSGFAIHHAGMLRADRSLVEKYFQEGFIKVLVCTSTLAWGVNLPAHAVIIKGTEIYDAKHGSFVDLGILDVLQIFGRAGRPQFDSSGHGTIITTHEKLSHYLSLLTNQFPIESNFLASLVDNLNAEIALGTISNLDEAVEWLSYTYLYVRMKMNPQVYGINYNDVLEDPSLENKSREFIQTASRALDKAHMIRFNERTGDLNITDLGRTASHFYIKYDTVEIFNELMKPVMTDGDILSMVSQSQEFEQLKVRDDELTELDDLTRENCEVPVAGGSENIHGKVNILLQTYLSRGRVQSFSLMSDTSYISQNAGRIVRALFEIVLRKNNPILAGRFLTMAKMFEQQLWDFQSPLRQFTILPFEILQKIEDRRLTIDRLREMDHREIGSILRHLRMGENVKKCAEEFPLLEIEETMQPITRTVLRIHLYVKANFRWNDRVHGKTSQSFWIWIEDPDSNFMYHHEYFVITKKQVVKNEAQELVMTIPLVEPLPPQYYIRAISDHWLGSEVYVPLTFQHLILPETHPPHTDLLSLQPLPVKALGDDKLVSLYKYSHFNPVQTQIFHCLYHTDANFLLGAPTGSGKTVAAEIAMFRVFREYPGTKVVYIAPLKALVRERIEDWKVRLTQKLGRSVVELTGDASPDARAMAAADVVVTTPEKWDGVSRSWSTRAYVRDVSLIIIDEIHLLGEERGPVLEIIVSRANYIASHGAQQVNTMNQGKLTRKGGKAFLHPGHMRIIGLSTALANARDLADWLGIAAGTTGALGLYNFRPSVRPVPLEVHISGFPGKHYCPRMATMNRPAFQAIRQHSPGRPSLIFVSSRRQTRLTALDLIACLAGEDNPKQWLHCPETEIETISSTVSDPNLRLTLAFGIGLHHAGLAEHDRRTVEELFTSEKIQVLIATATLAWGVNLPAHLVVIKGTEYYDGKTNRYADMPVTDVLQMMGRAGRPQFDKNGVAVVFVHDAKKAFYKKFLYEPFPVESGLHKALTDHIGAEVVGGIIQTKQEALDYLTWTYFFRRLMRNPVYYGLESLEPADVNNYLSSLVEETVATLEEADCVKVDEDGRTLIPTSMGQISSYYYLSHRTMRHFRDALRHDLGIQELLVALCDVYEYDQLPVRHNEDILNGELAKICPKPVDLAFDSPHAKAQLLFQAHFSRLSLPCADYYTDLKSVLDQAIRILQAMIDVSAENGWLPVTLRSIQLMQMVLQGRWIDDDPLITLPHIEVLHLRLFYSPCKGEMGEAGPLTPVYSLPELRVLCRQRGYSALADLLRVDLDESQIEEIYQVVCNMPAPSVTLSVRGWWSTNVQSAGNGEVEELEEERKFPQPPSHQDPWVKVHADQEYTLVIRFGRLTSAGLRIGGGRGRGRGRGQGRGSYSDKTSNYELGKAHCPRYHKRKDEGWFLILGNVEKGELMALKRATGCGRPWGGGGGGTMQQLSFRTPLKQGRLILTLYIMSDCYLGWDQQYDIHLDVIAESIRSHVNAELSDNSSFSLNENFCDTKEAEDEENSRSQPMSKRYGTNDIW